MMNHGVAILTQWELAMMKERIKQLEEENALLRAGLDSIHLTAENVRRRT